MLSPGQSKSDGLVHVHGPCPRTHVMGCLFTVVIASHKLTFHALPGNTWISGGFGALGSLCCNMILGSSGAHLGSVTLLSRSGRPTTQALMPIMTSLQVGYSHFRQ